MKTRELNSEGQFDSWPRSKIDELNRAQISEQIGTRLVYHDQSIRVWEIHLEPDQRLPFHKHTCDYTWTAVTAGKAISHYDSGRVLEIFYQQGDVQYYHHDKLGNFIHDLENIGKQPLIFSTVEYISQQE